MASLLPTGKQAYLDNGGIPLVGGKLYTFQAGTSTPKLTYSDQAGTVPNTNPVILNARGEAQIFWSGSYKVELRDALDNLIWSVDNIVESNADITTGTTGSLKLPAGTILQRDVTPSSGYIRYNTELAQLEYYSLAAWVQVQAALVSGTTIKTVNGVSLLGAGDVTIAAPPAPGSDIYLALNYGGL